MTYKTLALSACVNASFLEMTSEDAIKKKLDLASYKKLPKSLEVVVKFLEFGHRVSGLVSASSHLISLLDGRFAAVSAAFFGRGERTCWREPLP